MSEERTIATMFSGGEGVGVGARAAGFRHLWGIEHRADVAQVAEDNGFRSIVADVRDVDPETLEWAYALHVSPPCLDASGANGKRIESYEGRQLGAVVARFIRVLQPTVFTLENVWFYRNYDSFQYIVDALFEMGYMVNWQHLNSADYGVPQTRKRLILRAVLGSLLPMLPEPEPWIGWYAAIEDLIPTLPDSQFAPWQLGRLPDELRNSAIFAQGKSHDHKGGEYTIPHRVETEPGLTVTANTNQLGIRAFLVSNAKTERSDGTRQADEPALSVTTQSGGRVRAFLVGSQNAGEEWSNGLRENDDPAMTISTKQKPRAWLSTGRVVQLSIRALARLQSIPDSYKLPAKKTLACYVVGNAVPPLMYEKIIGQFR